MTSILSKMKRAVPFCILALLGLMAIRASAVGEQAVLRETLPNGLKVVIVRNPLAPVVTTVVNYRAGSDDCPPEFPGTAHATEHMMFRGSPGLAADQLAEVTAALGGDFNADTQQAVTQYFFTVPAEDLDVALHIEATRMQRLKKDESLWTKERGAIEQEVAQDLSNPEYVFYMKLLAAMFKGSPYEHNPLGTRESFDKTTGADLRKFHDTWYVPNNAILVVVGDVQPDAVLEKVKTYFGGIPSKKLPARPVFNFQPVTPETLNLDTDLPYGMVAITFRMPGVESSDYAAVQILSDVLSSERSTLYGLVPDGKALFASFSYESMPKSGLGYAVAGFPADADAPALLQQVKAILADTLTNGVLSELVEAAKRREIASAEFEKNSVSGLAMAWSQALAVEGRNSPDDDIEAVRKVTVADVNRVARQYLDFDHAISAILKPQPSGKPISTKSFGGKESFASGKATGARLPAWARNAVNRMEVPASSLNPIVTNLPNGLRLIVQPVAISDTVSVSGRVKNNPKTETSPGKEGAHEVLDRLFSYGTTSLDRLAFQKALDDIGANESAGVRFSVDVLSGQFERGVELLADNELNPALPAEDFKIIQSQLAAKVAGELKSPDYLAGRAVRTALFPPQDPSLRETTPETLKSLTIDDVKDYYRRVFRPDMTTIVVIGNVTSERAIAAITKYFGNWHCEGPKPDTLFPAVPANVSSATQVPDASRVQDKVTLAETLGVTRTNADYYALELGNHVLGGAFYATRLYHDLRENGGLVYFVNSSFEVGLARGVYSVSYACDPPKVSKARDIVLNNLKNMCDREVTAHELRQAKILLLREIPLSESSVDRVASEWLTLSGLGLPLNEPILAAQRYVQLDAPAVQAAFTKWIRPDDLIQVTQGPAPQ